MDRCVSSIVAVKHLTVMRSAVLFAFLFLILCLQLKECISESFDFGSCDKDYLIVGANVLTSARDERKTRAFAIVLDSTNSMKPFMELLPNFISFLIKTVGDVSNDSYDPYIICKFAERNMKSETPIIYLIKNVEMFNFLSNWRLIDVKKLFGEYTEVKESALNALYHHMLPHLSRRSEVILITDEANDPEDESLYPEVIRAYSQKRMRITLFQYYSGSKNAISRTSYVYNHILSSVEGMLYNVEEKNIYPVSKYILRSLRPSLVTLAYYTGFRKNKLDSNALFFFVDRSVKYLQIRITMQPVDPKNLDDNLKPYVLNNLGNLANITLTNGLGKHKPMYSYKNTHFYEYEANEFNNEKMFGKWAINYYPLVPVNPFIEVVAESELTYEYGFSNYPTENGEEKLSTYPFMSKSLLLILIPNIRYFEDTITEITLEPAFGGDTITIQKESITIDDKNFIYFVPGFDVPPGKRYCLTITGLSIEHSTFTRAVRPCFEMETKNEPRIFITGHYDPFRYNLYTCKIETSEPCKARFYFSAGFKDYTFFDTNSLPIILEIEQINNQLWPTKMTCEIEGGPSLMREFTVPIDKNCSVVSPVMTVDQCTSKYTWKGYSNYKYQQCPTYCYSEMEIDISNFCYVTIHFVKLEIKRIEETECGQFNFVRIIADFAKGYYALENMCGILSGRSESIEIFEYAKENNLYLLTSEKNFEIEIYLDKCSCTVDASNMEMECSKPFDLLCPCTNHYDCKAGSNCSISTGVCTTAMCDNQANDVNCPCVDGSVCKSKQCIAGVCKCETPGIMYCPCQYDSDCKAGLLCNEQTKSCQLDCSVVPSKPSCPCISSSYCASNMCDRGKCRDECSDLTVNCACFNLCEENLVCKDGFCINHCHYERLIGCECSKNSDCVSGICLNAKCSNLQICIKTPRHTGCACESKEQCVSGVDCIKNICTYPPQKCKFKIRPPSCPCKANVDCASGRCVRGKCGICLGVGKLQQCDCESPNECSVNLKCIKNLCLSDCVKKPYGTGCSCSGHLSCQSLLCESGQCSGCSFRKGIIGCPCNNPSMCLLGLACNPATRMCDKDCTSKSKPPMCSCVKHSECASGICAHDDTCIECITPKFKPGCPCTDSRHCIGVCDKKAGICWQVDCDSGNTINCLCQSDSDCLIDQICENKICVYSPETCSRMPLSPSCPCNADILCSSKVCVKGKCGRCKEPARGLNCDCDSPGECRDPLRCDPLTFICGYNCIQATSNPACSCDEPDSCLTAHCANDFKCDICGEHSTTGCVCKQVQQCDIGLTCKDKVCKAECLSKPLAPFCNCQKNKDCASDYCYMKKCGKCSSLPFPPKCDCKQINDCRTTCDPYSRFCADFCYAGQCRQGLKCVDTVRGPVCLSDRHCEQQLLPPDCSCDATKPRPCASKECNVDTKKCEPCSIPAKEGCPCGTPIQCEPRQICAMGTFYQVCQKLCSLEPHPPTCDCDTDKKCLSGSCVSLKCKMCPPDSKLENCNCLGISDCPKGLQCINGICQEQQCTIYPKYPIGCPCNTAKQCITNICSLGLCRLGNQCSVLTNSASKVKCRRDQVCDNGVCANCLPFKSTGCPCNHPTECPGYCDSSTKTCEKSLFCSNGTEGYDGCMCKCGKSNCINSCVNQGKYCKCMDCSIPPKSAYCPCETPIECKSRSCNSNQCLPDAKECSGPRKPPLCKCSDDSECNDGICPENLCKQCGFEMPRPLGCSCTEDMHCKQGKCVTLLDGTGICFVCQSQPDAEGCPCHRAGSCAPCVLTFKGLLCPGKSCMSLPRPPGCPCSSPQHCTDGQCVLSLSTNETVCGCKPLGIPGCPCAVPSDCINKCIQSPNGLMVCGGACDKELKTGGCHCTSPRQCAKNKCQQAIFDPPVSKCLECGGNHLPEGCPCKSNKDCKGACSDGICTDCITIPYKNNCPCKNDDDCVDKCTNNVCSDENCGIPRQRSCACEFSIECDSDMCVPQGNFGVFICSATCSGKSDKPNGCSCEKDEDCLHKCVGSVCTNCDLEFKPDNCPCLNDFNCINKCLENLCTKRLCVKPPFPDGCSCNSPPNCHSGKCVLTNSGLRKCASCEGSSREDGCGCASDKDCINKCVMSNGIKICACKCSKNKICHGTDDKGNPVCICVAGGSCNDVYSSVFKLPIWVFVLSGSLIFALGFLCLLFSLWRKKKQAFKLLLVESETSETSDDDYQLFSL